MVNSIKIYFGDVVNVTDDKKLNRIQVSIPNKTDEIDNLSWYYPFLGMDQLPIKGDKISVIIFNDDFTTGFYLKKLVDDGNSQTDFDGSEYENYLEIFKRNGIQLSYNENDGIQFINKNSKKQILNDEINLFVRKDEDEDFKSGDTSKCNAFKMTKDKFYLGSEAFEPTPLGDKTVDTLENRLDLMEKMYKNCMQMFEAIKNGCTNPYTLGIKMGLTPLIPINKNNVKPDIAIIKRETPKIVSEKTFIE